ncbi:MAG: hypothetical protein ACYDH1_21210, partial [Anaerolineaceae bacterium]
MREFLWKIELFFILAIRHPQTYVIPLSLVISGIFNSLEISEPIKVFIDNIPFVVGSAWLYSVLFAIIFYVLLNLLSLICGSVFGVQPFEIISKYIDSKNIPMNLANYVERKLMKSLESNIPLDYRVRIIDENDLELYNQLNRKIFSLTAFSLPIDKIRKRNTSLFKTNKCAFAFIEINVHGLYMPIGISHILPLNKIGKSF